MSANGTFDRLTVEVSPNGISRVGFGDRGTPSVQPPEGLRTVRDAAMRQLAEYLEGRRTRFDLPLDIGSATPFRKAVLDELLSVPFGATVSYRELADRVGCNSPRAVGQAVGWNPLPILIPCHRVVTRDGCLGGYSGGLDRKVKLLALEGIVARDASFSSPVAIRV